MKNVGENRSRIFAKVMVIKCVFDRNRVEERLEENWYVLCKTLFIQTDVRQSISNYAIQYYKSLLHMLR